MMKPRRSSLVSWAMIAAVSLCNTAPAAAQDSVFNFEVTPFAAYRVGGQFDEKDGDSNFELNDFDAQGIMLNVRANPNGQYEFLYAHKDTEVVSRGLFVNDRLIDLDVEYFHFGGAYLFDGDSVRPFIALSIGLSRFDPQIEEFDTENFFSASFGAGVQLFANKRFGVRLAGRVFTNFVDTDLVFRF